MSHLAYRDDDVNAVVEAIAEACGGWVKPGKIICPVCGGKASLDAGDKVQYLITCWGLCPDNTAARTWIQERGLDTGGAKPTGTKVIVPPKPKLVIDPAKAWARRKVDLNLRVYLEARRIKVTYPALAILRRADAYGLGLDHATFMMAKVTNDAGRLTGVQLTKLHGMSTARRRDCPKLSFGKIAGSFVALGVYTADAEMVIGEGVETTLSCMELLGVPAGRATLGAWNLPHQDVPPCKQVLIAVDRDAVGAGEQNAVALGQRIKARGGTAKLIYAPGNHKDFNDYARHR